MTHRVEDTTIAHVMETLIENGLDGMADALSVLLNEAMKLERSKFLQAAPFERTEGRRGYANGFKDKTIRSRLGELGLRIPQVRDTDDGETFYPQALERGLRSERALALAVAEMYVNGVSTRRVKEITRELTGLERLNKEIKRRTRVATLFPNEASLLRLVSAILAEVDEDWEASRIYLNMEAE